MRRVLAVPGLPNKGLPIWATTAILSETEFDMHHGAIAPEKELRAYLILLYRVSIQVRYRSSGEFRLPDRQLFDLMDAVHDIPSLLADHNHYFTDEQIRQCLQTYDDRWTESDPQHFSLIKTLSEAFERSSSGGVA
jgi:hypothetical protein